MLNMVFNLIKICVRAKNQPHLAPYDSVWHHLAPFGPVWPRVVTISPAWPLFNFDFKVRRSNLPLLGRNIRKNLKMCIADGVAFKIKPPFF